MTPTPQSVEVTLQKPVYGGDSLGHTATEPGKAIFVPFTLPGETIRARFTEQKRTFAKAELESLITAATERTTPPCPHFTHCGGCHYQHANYATQLAWKQTILRETFTRANLQLPTEIAILANSEQHQWHYRNRIRLAIEPSGHIAYRGRRSHELIAIESCPIAAPILIQTAQAVASFLDANPGPIAELELFTNPDESQLLLTLFANPGAWSTPPQQWLGALQAELPPTVIGIRMQLSSPALEPTILASTGSASLDYQAAGHTYRVDHGAFFQVNRFLIDPFVSHVLQGATAANASAWDLYAGVGLFARQLAHRGLEVIAVESAPASLHALRHNLAATSARAVASTTLDFLRRNREEREPAPDLIVLDPPRAGIGDQAANLLNAIHAPQIVYVSCDPTTLARDLRLLTQERYRIETVTVADMFPQTFHLESIVTLSRT